MRAAVVAVVRGSAGCGVGRAVVAVGPVVVPGSTRRGVRAALLRPGRTTQRNRQSQECYRFHIHFPYTPSPTDESTAIFSRATMRAATDWPMTVGTCCSISANGTHALPCKQRKPSRWQTSSNEIWMPVTADSQASLKA